MPSSMLPINPNDLKVHEKRANDILRNVSWKAKKVHVLGAAKKESAVVKPEYLPLDDDESESREKLSLIKFITAIGGDDIILSSNLNRVLRTLRTGLCVGCHIGAQYMKSSQLDELFVQKNKPDGGLTQTQKTEFNDKQNTLAAVTLFSAASYIVWELSSLEPEKVSSAKINFPGVPEMSVSNYQDAIDCAFFYYAKHVEPGRFVNDEYQLVTMTIQYFSKVLEEIKQRVSGLKHASFFTDVSYKLTDSDFTVQGFENQATGSVTSFEFNRRSFDDIVGNDIAKHEDRRTIQRLFCYDLKAKKNPILEFGGYQAIKMMHGLPGTGKSTELEAILTYGYEMNDVSGIPFLPWPWPDNAVSTFQGGSAERVIPWFVRLQDKDKVIFAFIDDGEKDLEDRTRQGVSAGVREVEGVFLRYTEGPYAIRRGNTVLVICTNLPEQIDRAILSRVQVKYIIEGAKSPHDFIDQSYIWWRKYEKIMPGFVNLVKAKNYEHFDDQKYGKRRVDPVGASSGLVKPADSRILALYDRLLEEKIPVNSEDFLGRLKSGVQEIYPWFTSRDERNIQNAVDSVIMDFDMPGEWFKDHGTFFGQDYETKKAMIEECMKANMGGLSFSDICLQETIRYLDSVSRIANVDRERKIAALLEDANIREEVVKRLKAEDAK